MKEELHPALVQGEKKKGAGEKEVERQGEKDSVEEQSSQ